MCGGENGAKDHVPADDDDIRLTSRPDVIGIEMWLHHARFDRHAIRITQ